MPFPTGRPPIYNEEMPPKVGEYIDNCIGAEEVPTTAGLSLYIGVNKDTIVEWSKTHDDFSVSYKFMMAFQEDDVWQNALHGKYNSNIAKLMLHNHGYSDKSEIKSQVKQETKTEVSVDDRIAKLMGEIERLNET